MVRKRQALHYDDADEVEYKDPEDKDKDEDDNDEDDERSGTVPSLGLGTVYEDDSVFSAYDYSHLLPPLEDDEPPSSSSKPLAVLASDLPHTDRVVQRPAAAVQSAAVTEQLGASGRVEFVCRLGLTVDEAAVITVKSRLYAAALVGRAYAGVAQVEVSSMAEIVPHELVSVSGSAQARSTSRLDMAEPVFAQGMKSPCHLKNK
jgi:hypothetical protein